jgi:hypothetical protein
VKSRTLTRAEVAALLDLVGEFAREYSMCAQAADPGLVSEKDWVYSKDAGNAANALHEIAEKLRTTFETHLRSERLKARSAGADS